MRFEDTQIETLHIDLNRLDEVMKENSMVRAGQWDYERVTYDYKFEIREGTYYLRVQGYATSGDVGAHDAYIQLMKPILGKYYYPHGIEYGEDEHFPDHLVNQCKQMLNKIYKEASIFAD
ncbi:YugN family protein [Bacillus niameyensis]|uniref:YugN family protein n=1 Tax=Bacillus niameyensis TaxID=1522308 RepID=UPI0007805E6B|nr:YugN family protein [Bacillus niameyensis]